MQKRSISWLVTVGLSAVCAATPASEAGEDGPKAGTLSVSQRIQRDADGQYRKTITIEIGPAAVEAFGQFSFVQIAGCKLLRADGLPMIPVCSMETVLPSKSVLGSVDVAYRQAEAVKGLNVPAFQAPPPMPGADVQQPPRGMVPTSAEVGLFPPKPGYDKRETESGGVRSVGIQVLPLHYDCASKDATLYREIEMEVVYRTDLPGCVKSFRMSKERCVAGDELTGRVTVLNTTDRDLQYAVSLAIREVGQDAQLIEQTAAANVASNAEKDVAIAISAPERPGHYRVEMVARAADSGQEIGRQQAILRVK